MRYTRTPLTTSQPFDLGAVKLHCRIDHSDEDTDVSALAYTATAEVEAVCDLALLSQTITTTTDQWPGCIIDLPVGPLAEGDTTPPTVAVIEVDGSETPVATGWWMEGGRYPRLHFTTTPGGRLRVTYQAGYGDTATSIPQDLRTAIAEQALRLYDLRGSDKVEAGIAPAAARIIARHRRVKL